MSGPASPDYTAQIASTFGGAPPAGPVMLGGSPMMPPPVAAPPPPPDPGMSVMPPPAPPPMSLASAPPPPAPAPAPHAAPGPEAPRSFLQRVHGAGSYTAPAHDTEMRSAPLLKAETVSNLAHEEAAIANNLRIQDAVIDEKLMFQAQADAALARQDAQEQAAAVHADQMKQRTADFDASVKALSAQSIDPGRYWASAGTGQKVFALISAAVGGFVSGSSGARNPGLDMINLAIDRDIKAQEMAYQATRDTMNAKQTAFSMAMNKYGDENAARAAVRASALDVVHTQLGQQAALWKGTEAANRANDAAARVADARMEQVRQGVVHTAPKTVSYGAAFLGADGLTYNEDQGRKVSAEMRGQEHELRKQGEGVAGQLLVEQAKGGAKADATAKDHRERWVPTSSTGKGYFAPTEKEAVEHREKQAVTQEVIDLVDKLKKDSKDLGYTGRAAAASGIPGTSTPAVKRVETNHKALMGAINRAQKFGALDKGATELLKDMTGDPFSIKGNEVNLDALSDMARENRRQIEKSATGEKPSTLPEGSVKTEWAK